MKNVIQTSGIIKIINDLRFSSLVLSVLQSNLLAFLLQFLASQCFIFFKVCFPHVFYVL